MDSHSLIALLSLAFGLGILHALDADHVMVISNFIGKHTSLQQSMKYCARWALGHGTALLVAGFFVFVLGRSIPVELSAYAEHGVGAVLVLLGIWVFWDLSRKRVHLHFHQHDDLPRHAHWHRHTQKLFKRHENHNTDSHSHRHSAVMIGLLHGTAGSAPLLALIPLTQYTSPWRGLAYLTLFALGVLLAMLLFGGVLSGAIRWLKRFGDKTLYGFRMLVAGGSVGLGLYLLIGGSA